MSQTTEVQTQVNRPPADNLGHLYWLDWLRFAAAFMVVAVHARGTTWVEWGRLAQASQTKLAAVFFALTRAGTEWVLVFFVLSGFLVGGKILARLGNGSFDLREYVIDRISRIWVPLIPAMLWSAAVALWLEKPVTGRAALGTLLGLQGVLFGNFAGNYPLWSLAYEIWFYFLGGFVGYFFSGGQRARTRAIFGIAVAFAVFTKLEAVFLFAWFLGASTYSLCRCSERTLLAAVGMALIAIGYVASQLRSATVSVNTDSWLPYAPSSEVATLILALGMTSFLPYLTQLKPRSELGNALNKMGGKLAAFSYTLYLTHYPALYIWEHYLPQRHQEISMLSVALYLLRISSCITFGWLCYLPFERQTGRLRKWLRKDWGDKCST